MYKDFPELPSFLIPKILEIEVYKNIVLHGILLRAFNLIFYAKGKI
jgi:hypothetical protein